jgi:DNA-directed RNA polymerase I subunit RPA2
VFFVLLVWWGGTVVTEMGVSSTSTGMVVGKVPPRQAHAFASAVRFLKIHGEREKVNGVPGLPATMEVAVIINQDNVFPGIFLSTDCARFIRPVTFLATGQTEWIGPLEQVYLEIAVTDVDIRLGETTHVEVKPTNMLSINASFVPFSDHNQSPRNMYQCQMGKQTMGTPCHAFPHRSDNKLYRIQNTQVPLVHNETHPHYHSEDYPAGANAVVAVISYTGYDMEDACIISKSSFERGWGHASVYSTYCIDLNEFRLKGEPVHHRFGNYIPGRKQRVSDKLDEDGLVHVGQRIEFGDPLYCIIDDVNKKAKIVTHKNLEPAIVSQIRIVSPMKGDDTELQLMMLVLRYNRNPVIGDKFSSRHGQKGVLSVLWPTENMPFSESGMQPDCIINPHAFPSRMTIGMLIESMAAKSGALHGTKRTAVANCFALAWARLCSVSVCSYISGCAMSG